MSDLGALALFCSMEPHLNDVDRKPINIMAFGRFNKLRDKGDAFNFRDSLGGLFLFSMTR